MNPFNPNDLNTLRRGFADLEAGRISDFQPRSEPTCGLWWTLTTLATALAIGAALGVLLWLVL